MYEGIAEHFSHLLPFLTTEDILKVIEVSHITHAKSGDLVIKEGDMSKKFGFLLSGLMRIYFIRDGQDYTFEFRDKYDVFGNLETIFSNKPSRRYYEVLEPSELMLVDYHELEKLFKTQPRLEAARAKILEDNFYQLGLKLEMYLALSPEERYQELLSKTPDLLQRVPQKYIATYLGITPVSLSRIRKRIS